MCSCARYTGKERDTESGLDYFGARYYASNMGRFMSPDWADKPAAVPYAQLWNPQSLNLYSYVGNNPLSRVDADGHCWAWLCNTLQRIWQSVNFSGNFGETFAETRTRKRDLVYGRQETDAQRTAVNGMSDKQVNNAFKYYTDADYNAKVNAAAAVSAAAMIGATGTQVTSKTLWQDGTQRIDVENPNPGQRPGQIQFQDGDGKYIYDSATGKFEGLSNSQSNQLMSKPGVQDAIEKGMKYLGK